MRLLRHRLVLLVLVVIATAACNTSISSSANAPYLGPAAFRRILVVVAFPDQPAAQSARQVGERELSARLLPLNATPSYLHLSSRDTMDLDATKHWATANGFDGLVTVSVLCQWSRFLPGLEYLRPDANLNVRFSVKMDSLLESRTLWTATVHRYSAHPLEDDLRALARVVGRRLRSQGIVPAG